MSIIITIFGFLFFSNAILLLLLSVGFNKIIRNNLLLLFSYGIGPFIPAIIFYALIWLFPGRQDIFYLLVLITICLFLIFLCRGKWPEVKKSHIDLIKKTIVEIKNIPKTILAVSVVFIGLYAIQLFAFPIIDNDSVFYLNQSEAVYENKNLDWQKQPEVKIRVDDYYTYNYSIRPGIPSLIASTYLFNGGEMSNYFSFRFLSFYYYLLLLFLFLYCIKQVCVKLNKNPIRSVSFGMLFFIFFWSLTRSLIFSAKEPVIYFFALLSIVVLATILDKGKGNWRKRSLLAMILGLNVFINLHGIIIECIILLLYLMLSRQKLVNRIISGISIFLISLPFGGFDLLVTYQFIFLGSLGLVKYPGGRENVVSGSVNQYQMTNTVSMYLRGKLQALTNIGVFGFNFWTFLLTLVTYFKKVMKDNLLKLIVLFIAVYYLIVIDPFFFNKNPVSIVLWGSSKYATLLVLLGMVVTSVFVNDLLKWFSDLLRKNGRKILIVSTTLLLISVTFYQNIIKFGTNLLLLTVPAYKDFLFYRAAIEKLYIVVVGMLIYLCVVLVLMKIKNNVKLAYYISNILMVSIILTPFFMTTVGKVPLQDSLSFIGKSERGAIEETNYEGDIFKVFYKAQETLSKGTLLKTDFDELSLYNRGHFLLLPSYSTKEYSYRISTKCADGENSIYNSSGVVLCEAPKK
jgi:hypothetical protein